MALRLTREQQYFNVKAKLLPLDVQKQIKSGITFKQGDLYHKTEVKTGGNVRLIDATNEKVAGVSSFDGDKLQKGESHVVGRIMIGYASVATADTTTLPETVTEYGHTIATVPAVFRNAAFIIKQDGKVLFDLPVSRALVYEKPRGVEGEASLHLDVPFMLIENKKIEMWLEFPKGQEPANDQRHFVETRLFTTTYQPK